MSPWTYIPVAMITIAVVAYILRIVPRTLAKKVATWMVVSLKLIAMLILLMIFIYLCGCLFALFVAGCSDTVINIPRVTRH